MTSRQELPIFELESAIVSTLREQARLILQAPTGSGKSTQVPQILLDHGLLGDGEVVILQPRRLAARLLSARVAQERNCSFRLVAKKCRSSTEAGAHGGHKH